MYLIIVIYNFELMAAQKIVAKFGIFLEEQLYHIADMKENRKIEKEFLDIIHVYPKYNILLE